MTTTTETAIRPFEVHVPEEDLVNRHLRLEVETLKAPARVERVATGKLRMVAPTPTDSTVIERVAPAPVPPRSVVARR